MKHDETQVTSAHQGLAKHVYAVVCMFSTVVRPSLEERIGVDIVVPVSPFPENVLPKMSAKAMIVVATELDLRTHQTVQLMENFQRSHVATSVLFIQLYNRLQSRSVSGPEDFSSRNVQHRSGLDHPS